MKLIIDLDEEMISLIKDKSVECFNVMHYGQILDAIYKGTPLTEVVVKIKALDTDCHVVYAVAIDDVLQILEEYTKGESE